MHDKDCMAMVASYIQSHGQPLDPPKEVNSSGPEELGSIPRHANIFYIFYILFLFFSVYCVRSLFLFTFFFFFSSCPEPFSRKGLFLSAICTAFAKDYLVMNSGGLPKPHDTVNSCMLNIVEYLA